MNFQFKNKFTLRSNVISFFGGNLDLLKIEKFGLMSEPSLKCENNASFKYNYTLKLFITSKMAYSCCYIQGRNLHFPDCLHKKF